MDPDRGCLSVDGSPDINSDILYQPAGMVLCIHSVCWIEFSLSEEGDAISRLVKTIIRIAGLGLTLIPAILFLTGSTNLDSVKGWMIAGMVVWFGIALVDMMLSKRDSQ